MQIPRLHSTVTAFWQSEISIGKISPRFTAFLLIVFMTELETIILAGGQSARMHSNQPKALARVADQTIIDRLISGLARQGLNRISIALGHIQAPFAEHFEMAVQHPDSIPSFNQYSHAGLSIDLRLLDTGTGCDTGGRLWRMSKLLKTTFVLCWCDALWDVKVEKLHHLHTRVKALVTILAVHPPGRFGRLSIDESMVTRFEEKPLVEKEWINGGLFIVEPEILDYMKGDNCSLECEVFPALAKEGKLAAFRHEGLWHCVDTPADHVALDRLVRDGAFE